MEENFDPMSRESQETSGGDNFYFDAKTGELSGGSGGEPPKKKKLLPLIISLAVVLAAAVAVVIIGVVTGAFLSDKNKVIAAVANTFETPQIIKDMDFSEFITSDAYTLDIKGEADDVSIDVEYLHTNERQAINGSIGVLGSEEEFSSILDDKQLKLKIPFLDDKKMFVYHYDQENTGYFMGVLEEYGITSKELNQFLESLHNGSEQGDSNFEANKELFKSMIEIYQNLEFKRIDKRTFNIDGKNVTCAGYETVITAQMINEILDSIQKAVDTGVFNSSTADMQGIINSLRYALSESNDLQIRMKYYIYKKKLAAVRWELNGEDAEIRFEGGTTRTQNIGVYVSGLQILKINGTTEGEKDTVVLSSLGSEWMRGSYNKGTGEFEASLILYNYDYSQENYYMKGKITKEKEYGEIEISELDTGDNGISMKMKFTIRPGATIKDIEGEEFDIGNATVYECMEFFGDIYDRLF